MQNNLLCDDLDEITHSYDYGIVPGSATVFVRDELSGIVKLDMTLLEGVMVVIEISSQEFRVCSCLPISNSNTAIATAQTIQKLIEVPFESMDNLLLAISPMFHARFQQVLLDKLESVHKNDVGASQDQFLSLKHDNLSPQTSMMPEGPCSVSLPTRINNTQMPTHADLEEFQHWINRV